MDVEHNGPDHSDQREGKKRERLPEIVGQAEEGGRNCEIGKGLLLKLCRTEFIPAKLEIQLVAVARLTEVDL